jgi:hypothetical protein
MFFVGQVDEEAIKKHREAVRFLGTIVRPTLSEQPFYIVKSYFGKFIFEDKSEAELFDNEEIVACREALELYDNTMKFKLNDNRVLGGYCEELVEEVMAMDMCPMVKKFLLETWSGSDFLRRRLCEKVEQVSYKRVSLF